MRGVRISWCKTVVVLFVVLATLQLLHMILLTRLEHRSLVTHHAHQPGTNSNTLQELYKSMKDAVGSNELVDTSGEYKIVWDITGVGVRAMMNEKVVLPGVTLVTQCSVNHLHHIITLMKHWGGPVSVAVFATNGNIQVAVETIAMLHQCFHNSRKNITFNLVLPLSDNSNIFSKKIDSKAVDCDKLNQHIYNPFRNFDRNYDLSGVKYPNNLLRNVALANSNTKYIIVTDIDMVPNHNLYNDFLKILQQQKISRVSNIFESKTAYVIPAFEMRKDAVIPQDKSKLLEMWRKHEVRPFYNELCWKCQRYTDYEAWRNLTITRELRIAYEVAWRDPWEPFYIADVQIPKYDERFRQYGFNRISQVCEMHVAGYKFAVLNNAFLVHRGFKTSESFHRTKQREEEHNKQLFRQFKQELKVKYSDTSRRCY